MKVDIKKSQLIQIYFYVALLLASVAITSSLYMWHTKLGEKSAGLQSGITEMNQKITKARNAAGEYQKALETWNRLNDNQRQINGVNIDKARELIAQLQKKYRILKVDVNMTSPIVNPDISRKHRTKEVEVEESRVTIDFTAITDVYAFSFINALHRLLPGFMKMGQLRMDRGGALTPAMLEKMAQGDFPPLVKGKLEFVWQDFKRQPAEVDANNNKKKP
ncbi:MAG: hypothetical protein IPP74_08075 [Alphaproteobacteria bacterium]|nr:hypothetical protein [Alphaproteobacteria bacterium]